MGRSAAPERKRVKPAGKGKSTCKHCGKTFADEAKKIVAHLTYDYKDGSVASQFATRPQILCVEAFKLPTT